LCEAFARDEDIHARVASQIYGVPLEAVTPEMRRKAKAVNFGVIYGQSPYGLAQQLRIPQEEAAQFIDAYFANYPTIEKFMAHVLETCRQQGYVTTILGRRRPITGVRLNPGRQKNLAERTAINTVIQGSAADLIKLAMIAIHREMTRRNLPARMILQIHDELVFEVEEQALPEVASMVGQLMSSVFPLRVPLKVDLAAGPSWGELEPLT
jgi:DNA polymerase-1